MNSTLDNFGHQRKKLVSDFKILQSSVSLFQNGNIPLPELTELYIDIGKELQKEINDLETKEFRIAVVGGFNAGKSMLINSIIGDYLLPEANKALTSIPTYLKRSTTDENEFYIHYLSKNEFLEVKKLYKEVLSEELGDSMAIHLGDEGLITRYEEEIANSRSEGKTSRLDTNLLNHFKVILDHEKRMTSKIKQKTHIVACDAEKAFNLIQNDVEGAFIDRIEIRVKGLAIPEDVIIVDLPGVSVANPRHKKVTIDFITKDAHAAVLVLSAKRSLDDSETSILKNYIGSNINIQDKLFWVINQWDLLSDTEKKDVDEQFNKVFKDYDIKNPRIYNTSAKDGLISGLYLQNQTDIDNKKMKEHFKNYEEHLEHKYNGSHEIAYHQSKVKNLKEDLFEYLNSDIKKATLNEKIENIGAKIKRIHGILYKAQTKYQYYLREELNIEQRQIENNSFEKKKKEVFDKAYSILIEILDTVVDQIGKMKTSEMDDVWQKVEETYTDKLDLEQEFRKIMRMQGRDVPVYFEIETQILTNLNTLIKDKFSSLQREGISLVFSEYEKKLVQFSAFIEETLSGEHVKDLEKNFREIVITKNKIQVSNSVEDLAKALMAELDQVMVWTAGSEEDLFLKLESEDCQEILKYYHEKFNALKNKIEKDSFLKRINKKDAYSDIQECLNAFNKIEKLLDYAFPKDPNPAQKLTTIAKLTPKELSVDENKSQYKTYWETKTNLFNDFLKTVYQKHMKKVVTQLNKNSWHFVRNTLSNTEEELNELLSKYVVQRLEENVKSKIAMDFQKKREAKEKIQSAIGEQLKPFTETKNNLEELKKQLFNIN